MNSQSPEELLTEFVAMWRVAFGHEPITFDKVQTFKDAFFTAKEGVSQVEQRSYLHT